MFSFLLAIALYLTKLPVTKPALPLPLPAAFVSPAVAADQTIAAAPVKVENSRLSVETTSRSALIVDWQTGVPLFEKNADAPQAIASITKLVTALTVMATNPDWDSVVDITAADMRDGGISYLMPGDRLPLKDVFNVMLVASSNEAAAALARSTGMSESEFASKMNDQAARLGMTNAHFVEPTGLDARDMASARDVAFLLRTALDQERIREATGLPEFTFHSLTGRTRTVRSTDDLLGSFLDKPPYSFLGGKTGFVNEAGYCFAAAAENQSGHRIIAVALGAPSKDDRFQDVKAMIYWAFDVYRWTHVSP